MSSPARSIRRWGPLTGELSTSGSAVRTFIGNRFPNTAEIQQRYRERAGGLQVPGTTAPSATVGGAFDWLVRFMSHPMPDLHLALVGTKWFPDLMPAAAEMAGLMGFPVVPDEGRPVSGVSCFEGPVPGTTAEEELLLRGCWALALLTDTYRVGLRPGSPLLALSGTTPQAGDLLDLAPGEAVEELRQLRALAETALMPALRQRPGPWALGPTFDGSRLMNADADLVAGGLLVEVKTSLGDKRADGTRRAAIDRPTLQQLLGYVLLDFTNQFRITEIALYAARYGYLAVWDLQDLLNKLAGKRVYLPAERAAFSALLCGTDRAPHALRPSPGYG